MNNQSPLILIVEDNEANMETFWDYLEFSGYSLVSACDGSEAIELAQKYHPSLILMDIHMPGMDGLEATRIIKGDQSLADITIIALTALAMPQDRLRGLAAGVDEYVTKPISLRSLTDVIESYI